MHSQNATGVCQAMIFYIQSGTEKPMAMVFQLPRCWREFL